MRTKLQLIISSRHCRCRCLKTVHHRNFRGQALSSRDGRGRISREQGRIRVAMVSPFYVYSCLTCHYCHA